MERDNADFACEVTYWGWYGAFDPDSHGRHGFARNDISARENTLISVNDLQNVDESTRENHSITEAESSSEDESDSEGESVSEAESSSENESDSAGESVSEAESLAEGGSISDSEVISRKLMCISELIKSFNEDHFRLKNVEKHRKLNREERLHKRDTRTKIEESQCKIEELIKQLRERHCSKELDGKKREQRFMLKKKKIEERKSRRDKCFKNCLKLVALKPSSPPPLLKYNKYTARLLLSAMKSSDDSTASSAKRIFSAWLQLGYCNKRNCVEFFNILYSVCKHYHSQCLSKLNCLKEKLSDAKSNVTTKNTFVSICLSDLAKVLETVKHSPNIWNCFSCSQKKEFERISQVTEMITKQHSNEVVDERIECEMETSDVEENDALPVAKHAENKKMITKEELLRVQVENRNLQAQRDLELAENERVKKHRDDYAKAFQNVCNEMKNKIHAYQQEISELMSYKEVCVAETKLDVSQQDVMLMTLASTFLHAHPFGAQIDYICSYLSKVNPDITRTDVEILFGKFPNLFAKHTSGVGATLSTFWTFLGFSKD